MTLLTDIDDDLSVFYDIDLGFAENITGPSGTVVAIFDNDYESVEPDEVLIAGANPIIRTQDDDAFSAGDTVTIRTVNYTVVEVQPTGFGETIHELRLA